MLERLLHGAASPAGGRKPGCGIMMFAVLVSSALLSCVLGVGSPEPHVPAEEAPRPSPDLEGVGQTRPIVIVSISGMDDDGRLASLLMDEARRLGHEIQLVDQPLPDDDTREKVAMRALMGWSAELVVWLDLSHPSQYRIDVLSRDDTVLRSRRLYVSGRSSASAHEAVLNIAASAIAELPAPPPPGGSTPAPAAEPQPVVAPAPAVRMDAPVRRWPRLWLGAHYAGNTFADAVPWQSAIGVTVGWAPIERLHIDIGYDGVFPSRATREDVELSLRRHPVRANASIAAWQGDKVELGFSLGASVDPVLRSSSARSPAVKALAGDLRVFSTVTAGFFVAARPVPRLRLVLDLLAEGVLTRARYVVSTTSGATVLIDPHPARFLVRLGAQVGLLVRPRNRAARTGRADPGGF